LVGQVTETDLAQDVTVVVEAITIAVGQVVETDLAQAVTPFQSISIAVGQVTEIDLAQPVTVSTAIIVAVGQVTETDLAQDVTVDTGGLFIAVGQVTETDLAQTVTPIVGAVTIAVGQVVETDLAQVVTVTFAQTIAVGQVVETDLSQAVTFVPPGFGDKYNAAETFPTGSTVTIALFDPITEAAIAVDSNVCRERGTSGSFIWGANKLTTQPIGYQEYLYEMTDGTTTKADIIRLPQHELIDYIKSQLIYG